MESIVKQRAFGEAVSTETLQQQGECARFAQGRFLDELPGAAFVTSDLVTTAVTGSTARYPATQDGATATRLHPVSA
jgi:hypothetical protein